MKLAIVTETFPPEVNGVAMTFGRLARELGQRGHQVTVYHPRRDDLAPPARHPAYAEVLVHGLPIPGYPELRLGIPAPFALRQRWRRDRPDLVHIVTEGPLGASAINAARELGLPLTSSFHTNFHTYTSHYGCGPLQRLALAWLRRVHNRTQRTFAPTTELCEELQQLGFQRLAVLSRGVDVHLFSPDRRSFELRASWGAGPDNPVVLHVGRMAPEKNYPLLFRVFAAMRAANPRLRFVIAGEGPLKAQLQRENPDYIFAGFFSREEIGRYYASADIYIHASLTETFGNVLTEAMASGLAVAGFNYAAARQFIQTGINGVTVPVGDEASLIQAGVTIATDPALRAAIGPRARETLATQSWDQVVTRFESDLANVVEEHRAPVTPMRERGLSAVGGPAIAGSPPGNATNAG